MSVPSEGWTRVVFLAECAIDDDGEQAICPVCDSDYADCPCPGPHQDDMFEYMEAGGVLYARPLPIAAT